uniref:Uncharacterized protein n=1 Tax=Oryza rufipogon TaxID=4529 RepID=A0A0E0QJ61_ORYRU
MIGVCFLKSSLSAACELAVVAEGRLERWWRTRRWRARRCGCPTRAPRAPCTLHAVARHSATPVVHQEMLAVGVVARLLFLVQVGISGKQTRRGGHFDEFAPFEPATARSSPYVPPSPRRRCQQGDETIAWHADGRRGAVHEGAEEETWWGTWGTKGK